MPKRSKANGEGSIVYEADRKKYRAYIIDPDGKRLTKRFSIKANADKWLSEIKTDIAKKTYVSVSDKKLLDWIFEYLDVYKKDKIRKKTMERYLQTAKYIAPIGNINLQDLTAHQVQKFYKTLPPMSDSSKSKIHKLLAAAIKKAYVLNIVQKNIMIAVEGPIVRKKEIVIFTQTELKKISDSLKTSQYYSRYYPIYLTAITTGARLGEILGLKRKYVFNGYIKINTSLQVDSNGNLYDEEPKTDAGKRKITIPPELQTLLYEIMAQDKIIQLDGYVFHTANGTPISPHNMSYRAWRGILKEAGVPYKTFHCLRHTHATQLLAAGVPILEVAKRLGHSKASHTLNIYGHAIPDYDKSLPEKISKIFIV